MMSLKNFVNDRKESSIARPRLTDIHGKRKDKNLCGICDDIISPTGIGISSDGEDYAVVQIGTHQNERPIKGKRHLTHYRLKPGYNLSRNNPKKDTEHPCGVCGDEVILKSSSYGSMDNHWAFQEHAVKYVPRKNNNGVVKTYDHLEHYVLVTQDGNQSVIGISAKR